MDEAGARHWKLQWGPLVANVLFAVALAFAADAISRRLGMFRKVAALYGSALLLAVAIGFVTAIAISRHYWGYWLSPPGALPEVATLGSVDRVVAFQTQNSGGFAPVLVAREPENLKERLGRMRDSSAEFDEPLFRALESKRLLPEVSSSTSPKLTLLGPALVSSRRLVPSESGYHSERTFWGYLVIGTSIAGETLWLVSCAGGQLSNDHYPWYDFAFRKSGKDLQLVNEQHYFYDAAGMEGFEWYVMWPIFAVLLTIIAWLIVTIWLGLRSPGNSSRTPA